MRTILSRRQFLGAVGASLGYASIGTFNSLASSVQTPSAYNLGFNIAESKYYPDLASELIEGLSHHVSNKLKIARLQETDLSSLRDFARQFDAIITYASPSHAHYLKKNMADISTPLIALDLGMDIQRFGESLPNLDYISLDYWQLAQALGLWVKEELGERLMIVTDTYSSGYDTFSVFESNFPQATILFYESESLAETLKHEHFDTIAFALTDENVQDFISTYEALAIQSPLIRLPYVGKATQTTHVIYSANFGFDNTPFYTLGKRAAMLLSGQTYEEAPILIKRNDHTIAQYTGNQLPYHGINSRFKTGWTNAYPI